MVSSPRRNACLSTVRRGLCADCLLGTIVIVLGALAVYATVAGFGAGALIRKVMK